jgi:hypothetical protein
MDSPSHFFLPDLVSYCTYPLRTNPNGEEQARASEEWLIDGSDLSPRKRKALTKLKSGDLTAACFPDTEPSHLRVCCDYINFIFTLDDWLEELDVQGNNSIENWCVTAMRDPVNFQTDKKAALLMKSYVTRISSLYGEISNDDIQQIFQPFLSDGWSCMSGTIHKE